MTAEFQNTCIGFSKITINTTSNNQYITTNIYAKYAVYIIALDLKIRIDCSFYHKLKNILNMYCIQTSSQGTYPDDTMCLLSSGKTWKSVHAKTTYELNKSYNSKNTKQCSNKTLGSGVARLKMLNIEIGSEILISETTHLISNWRFKLYIFDLNFDHVFFQSVLKNHFQKMY
ncbi:hypothetical protein AGLY_011150 [Aphis glycines]|uniref:Uncharacterized protein n=1 Tax=Aphis glycines TaxID=307491 RepID=A0A6G0TD83_APHGL|nr:hypothetical protein AGLY_011150 [Aphis glycines]